MQTERNLGRVNQSFIKQYMLGVQRFNSSDRGYYWCQMVVNNNISLSPSPYGYIYSSQCTFLDVTCTINPPLCAHNMNTRYMARKNVSRCSLEDFSSIIPTSTTTMPQIVTMSSIHTTETATIPKPSLTTAARMATMSQMITMSSIHTTETITIAMSSFATTEITTITTSSFPTTEIASTIVAVIILFMLTILVVSIIVCIKKHKCQSKLTTHDKLLYCYIYPNNTCLIAL